MTFPLPNGYCRSVCRPKRVSPRLVTIREVVRFARTAVKNGDRPCDIVSGVADAVGCDCKESAQMVADGIPVLREAQEELISRMVDLANTLGFGLFDLKDAIPRPQDGLLRRLWRRLSVFLLVKDIVEQMYAVFVAGQAFFAILDSWITAVSDLLTCLEGGK